MIDFRNIIRAVSNPELAWNYARYLTSLAIKGEAVRAVSTNTELGGFTGFSEYYTSTDAVAPREMRFLKRYPFGSGSVIDVGANLGLVSLLLAERYSDRDVHAFEPNPSTAQSLRENLRRNEARNVKVCQTAVGNETGTIRFRGGDDNRATARRATDGDSSVISVPCTTLDDYVEKTGIDEIALLKVDVEGYEADVLRGSEELLQEQKVNAVYFEVCPALEREAGFEPGTAASILVRAGYRLHRIVNGGTFKEVEVDRADEVDLDNWVALQSRD
ncbi:FkbM family methyltransferase [Salinibacter ruber]|uniref:FkbM family methyltransferase n=1 Tax=Salinibacter ruber TaxID=146919 RepID=UPI002167977F|nr:FkbM family methyltransferase [Salinibacter ruber]MCS3937081.1 FkbM family methyltransferase [Salinibacter ruber]